MVELSEEILKILEDVKEELRPTEEEVAKGFKLFEEVREAIESSLQVDCDFKVTLEGSFAKGTSLKNDIDLDVFILLKKEDLSNEWIEENVIKQLLGSGLRRYEARIKYASHPYITLRTQGFEVDVVPAYWAGKPDEITTAVDRTPFHTRYINSRLNDSMRDEVRLLKKFMKSMGIYGAEVRVEGFSGYLTELMIVKYGTFLNTLEAVAEWREGEVIIVDDDVMREYGSVNELKKVFRGDALIVPDPVDPRRNAASAVSERALKVAVVSAYSFMRKPSKTLFYWELKPASPVEMIEFLNETDRRVLLLRYTLPKDVPPDVLWGELKRLSRRVANLLRVYRFEVIDYDCWSDESTRAFIAVDLARGGRLPAYEVREGPPNLSNGLHDFIEKHSTSGKTSAVWIARDGLPKALVRRRYRDPGELLHEAGTRDLTTKDLRLAEVIIDWRDLPEDLKNDEEFMKWLTSFTMKMYPYILR